MSDGRTFIVDERSGGVVPENGARQSGGFMEPCSDTVYDGIDVSQWQEDIDWQQVARTSTHIVYIRVANGAKIDYNFEKNYEGAKAAGLKVGFYYFVSANDPAEAREQARFFWNLVKDKDFNCRLVGDYEEFGNHTNAEINAIAKAFFDELEGLAGHRPMLYTSHISAGDKFDYDMTYYPIWIAHYHSPGDLPFHPGLWNCWYGYQYTEKGQIPGIHTDVDKNLFTDGVIIR